MAMTITPGELALKIRGTDSHSVAIGDALRRVDDESARVKRGTMRAWFQAHHGQRVDTVQAQPNGGAWAPLGRVVDAKSLKRCALMDSSARDYAGCKVLHADDDTLLISYDFGGPAWALYMVAP